MNNPKIISVCSKCNVKSSCCKLVQYNKSKNYNIICNKCYSSTHNINDVVLKIANYGETSEHSPPVSCFQKYKTKTIKCCHYLKKKAKRLGNKLYMCFKSINFSCIKKKNEDMKTLEEV